MMTLAATRLQSISEVRMMDSFGNILASISQRARENNPQADVDYIGEDGLLYCGKCHTRKEYPTTLPASNGQPAKEVKFPVMCKCREEELRREEEFREKQKEMEHIKALKISSLMDDKFRDSTFDAFEVTKQNARPLKLCKRYTERFDEMLSKNQGLLFYGNVGTGKTYMAACISNYLMDRLVPVVMTSFVKILQNVQAFRTDEDEEAFIRKMNRAKLLVIDDLGAERSTDFALEKVYNIIDSRYRARKPMILTTNLTLTQMQSAGDIRYTRIYDRIFEVCHPIEFKGESWRKKEAADRFEEMTRFLEGEDEN